MLSAKEGIYWYKIVLYRFWFDAVMYQGLTPGALETSTLPLGYEVVWLINKKVGDKGLLPSSVWHC